MSNRSHYGGKFPDDDDDDEKPDPDDYDYEDLDDNGDPIESKPSSSNPFARPAGAAPFGGSSSPSSAGSNPPRSGSPSGSSASPGSSSSAPRSSPFGGGSSSLSSGSSGSGASSSGSGAQRPTSPFGSGSSGSGSSGASGGSSAPGNRPGGGIFGSAASKADDKPKPPEANKPGSNPLNRFAPGQNKPPENKPADKPGQAQPAKKDEGGARAGLFGRLGGGKPDDKGADKPKGQDAPKTGAPAAGSTAGNRPGGLFGGGSSSPASSGSPGSGSSSPSSSGPASGSRTTGTFGAPSSTQGARSTGTTGAAGSGTTPAGSPPGNRGTGMFGAASAGSAAKPGSPASPSVKPGDKPAAKPPDKKPADTSGGGILGRFRGGGKPDDKASDKGKPPPAKTAAPVSGAKGPPPPRSEKTAPKLDKSKKVVVKRAFSQDHQLDIFGIGMVFLGMVMFFGVFSPGGGSITSGLVDLITQAFGDAKYVCWVPCVFVGGWLILRHFRDEPPILQYHRLIGWIFVFLALVTTVQLVELLSWRVPRLSDLALLSAHLVTPTATTSSHGGGWLGDKLYMLLETMLGDYGTVVVVVAAWIIALMLALNLTLTHITNFLQSIAHWMVRVETGRREAQTQARAAATLRAQAKPAPMAIAAPAPAAALPAGAATSASIAPAKAPGGLFSRASSAPPPTNTAPVETRAVAQAGQPSVSTPAAKSGGLFGSRAAPAPPAKAPVAEIDQSANADNAPASDKFADKPAPVPAKPFGSGGLFGSRAAPPPPVKAGAATDAGSDKVDGSDTANAASADKQAGDKPSVAAPSKPMGGGIFGSRSAPPPPKPANAPAAQAGQPDNSAKAEKADGKSTDAPPTDKAADKVVGKPVTAGAPATQANKPFGSGLFGSRSAPPPPKPAEANTADTSEKANGKPTDGADAPDVLAKNPEQSALTPVAVKPSSGGLFGSRTAAPPPKQDSAAPDGPDATNGNKNSAPSDQPVPAPASKPVPGGLFSAQPVPAKPDAAQNSTGARSAPAADKSDTANKAVAPVPKAPIGGGVFGSRPTPPKPGNSTILENLEDDDDEADAGSKPSPAASVAMPKASAGGGLFSSRPAPSKPATPQSLADQDDAEEDDEADTGDKASVAAPKASAGGGLFGSRPAPSKPAAPVFGGAPGKTGSGTPADKPDKVSDAAGTDSHISPAAPAAKAPVSGGLSGGGSRVGGSQFPAAKPTQPASSSLFARPVPKPGAPLTSPPEPDDAEEDEADAEPKYVALDDVEGVPPPASRPAQPATSPFGSTARATSPFGKPADKPVTAGTSPATPLPSAAPKPPGASPFAAPRPAQPAVSAAPTPAPLSAPPAASAPTAPAPAANADANVSHNEPIIRQPSAAAAPTESAIPRDKTESGWELPDYREALDKGTQQAVDRSYLLGRSRVIEETLQSFGAPGKVVEINSGPVITQFGVEPDYLVGRQGKKTRVKVSSIAKLDADLALALAARSIRVEAPVPGKGFVGIEVPNAKTALVCLRDIIESESFRNLKSKLRIGLGQSVDGAPISADLTVMPHLLIAGTTGSGKSVCVNAIIACLLLENTPDDLKFIMVDPKRVELTGYNGIPHLVAPVVVDLERIVSVLKWVTREMDERYKRFSQVGARHILDYNTRIASNGTRLPYLVVVIDELADLMMLAPDETEKVLTRLAQMARATGIHLIVSTQRPSTDVVTGLIKANFPARISFAVASNVDSRVILDQPGAEKLLGRGDMLYQAPDAAAPVRMQGVFVSDAEINRITNYWKTAKAPAGASAQTASARDVFTAPEPVQSRADKYKSAPSTPSSTPAPMSSSSASSVPIRTATGVGTPISSGTSSGGARPTGTPSGTSGPAATPSNAPKPPFASAPNAAAVARPTLTAGDEEDEMYDEAVDLVKHMDNKVSVSLLQRRLRIGYNRAERLIDLMKQRGVIDAASLTEAKIGDEE